MNKKAIPEIRRKTITLTEGRPIERLSTPRVVAATAKSPCKAPAVLILRGFAPVLQEPKSTARLPSSLHVVSLDRSIPRALGPAPTDVPPRIDGVYQHRQPILSRACPCRLKTALRARQAPWSKPPRKGIPSLIIRGTADPGQARYEDRCLTKNLAPAVPASKHAIET